MADEDISQDVKRKKISTEDENDLALDLGADDDRGESYFDGRFKPFYYFGMWEEAKTGTKRLSVAIVLFSGVTPEDFTLSVLPGGRVLEMRCAWPVVFTDIDILYRRWFCQEDDKKIIAYHPRLNAFEAFYINLRECCNDKVYAVSRIRLPLVVETHILKSHFLGYRESAAKGVYVELRSLREQYASTNEKKEFEIY
ncbi:hypothetical protein FGB62_325g07 [Gracilaria domingensis]|nr:hypothetical protein FGB62_325g07 [Gracilaria domingensis]